MKVVKFPMYFEVCGYQTIPLPDCVDANSDQQVKEYIDEQWEYIKLPSEYDYVGDSGFDFDSDIIITEYE